MACHTAVDEDCPVINLSTSVGDALAKLKEKGVDVAAILDDNGGFFGLFSFKILLGSLIPVSFATMGDVTIDMKVAAAPGVYKRLGNIMSVPVSEVVNRKPVKVLPDVATWEVVAKMTNSSSPLVVVDANERYIGIITYKSLLRDMERMLEKDS